MPLYKIVSKFNKQLASSNTRSNGWLTYYEPGKWTFPPFMLTKLFVLSSPGDFDPDLFFTEELWECECTGVEPVPDWIPLMPVHRTYEQIWDMRRLFNAETKMTQDYPSALMAMSVKLTKRIVKIKKRD